MLFSQSKLVEHKESILQAISQEGTQSGYLSNLKLLMVSALEQCLCTCAA